MTFCRRPLVIILLTQLSIAVSLGQTTSAGQETGGRPNRSPSERHQRALNELEEALTTAREFGDSDLRIRVQVQAADILWRVDEQRARQLFVVASRLVPPPPATDAPTRTKAGDSYRLQMDLLFAAARRDPALTESLIQSAIGGDAHPGPWQSYRAFLLLDIAPVLRQTNPELAARMAMAGYEVLPADSSADQTFSSLLYSLKSNNAELSDQLFDHAISVLSRQPERALRAISWMAPYVFPDFRRPSDPASSPQPPHTASVRYLELVHNAISRVTRQSLYSLVHPDTLKALFPYFERYAPGKRISLETMMKPATPERAASSPSATTTVDSSTAAETLRDPAQRDTALERAAAQAQGERQFEKALTVAGQITDEFQRSRMMQEIHYPAARAALRQGEIEAAIPHARAISRPNLRAALISEAISTLRKKKQETRAFAVLNEEWHWVQEVARDPEKVEAMLRLAGEAAVARLPAAFQMMESVVDEINLTEFAPAWWQWKTFDPATPEAKTRVSLQVGILALAYSFPASLGMLSRVDFDKAMALVRKIRMKEVSVFAQLAICQDVLLSYPR